MKAQESSNNDANEAQIKTGLESKDQKLSRNELLQMMIQQLQYWELNSLAALMADTLSLDPHYCPQNELAQLVQLGRDTVQQKMQQEQKDESVVEESTQDIMQDVTTTSQQRSWGPCLEQWRDPASSIPAERLDLSVLFTTTHKLSCTTAAFSPDGRYFATGSEDTSLKVLDSFKIRTAADGDDKPLIRTYYDHLEPVNEVCFHPNGKVLASCSDDCTIKLYDLLRLGVKRAFRFLQDSHPVKSIAFHPSGDYLLAGTESNALRIYDVKYLKCFTASVTQDLHQGPVHKVQYAPMGNLYVSAGQEGSIKLWDGISGRCFRTIDHAHSGTPVSSVCFSKNARFLLSSGQDSTVKLWDTTSGRILMQYTGAVHQQTGVNASFSWNEDLVVSADEATFDIVTWCSRTGKLLNRFPAHSGSVHTVTTSPKDNGLVTCGTDCKARYWNSETS